MMRDTVIGTVIMELLFNIQHVIVFSVFGLQVLLSKLESAHDIFMAKVDAAETSTLQDNAQQFELMQKSVSRRYALIKESAIEHKRAVIAMVNVWGASLRAGQSGGGSHGEKHCTTGGVGPCGGGMGAGHVQGQGRAPGTQKKRRVC
jgi:hypothetical protein